jgi:hypothetical protein
MRHDRHRSFALVALLASVMATLGSASAGAGAPPDVAYTAANGSAVMTASTVTGVDTHSFPAYQWYSLDGDVLAGSRHTHTSEAIVASDASTGERLFKIADAFAPVVLADGRKVGFLPDRFAHRDPWFASVWLRNAAGRERAVVRFAGNHTTVNARDFEGEGAPLDESWSADGNTLAVTFGNDVDLFIYDVWVVDARTRTATRVTKGHVSRFPSLSPSGERLAFLRETENCGGPDPGYRTGDLRIVELGSDARSTLSAGDCDSWLTDPQWISEDELLAARLTRSAPGAYDVDLVRVDATTGVATLLVSDISSFTASADEQLVAYTTASSVGGFVVRPIASAKTTPFGGYYPVLSGAHQQV